MYVFAILSSTLHSFAVNKVSLNISFYGSFLSKCTYSNSPSRLTGDIVDEWIFFLKVSFRIAFFVEM